MKTLSVIFFVSSFLSLIPTVLTFFGKFPGKGKDTAVMLVAASVLSAICGVICMWNSPKGLILVISGVLLINLLFAIATNEKAEQ